MSSRRYVSGCFTALPDDYGSGRLTQAWSLPVEKAWGLLLRYASVVGLGWALLSILQGDVVQ